MDPQALIDATRGALSYSRETLDAIANACPLAVMILDERGHVHFWNSAAERIFGWSKGEVLERFLPTISEDRREEFVANLQHVFERRELRGVETQRLTRDRGPIEVQLWANLIELSDGQKFCLTLISDVSQLRRLERQNALQQEQARRDAEAAAEQAQRQAARLRLLAETSSILSSSLDFGRTLEQLTKLLVPSFADVCSVSIITAEGRLERVAEAALNDDVARTMMEFRAAGAPQEAAHPMAEVVQAKQARLFKDYTNAVTQRLPADHPYTAFTRTLGTLDAILVPLIRGERVIGALGLATLARTGRTLTEEDLTLATAIAERAAVAIENARLHERALEADRRKDEFLAMLGHELRNPLAPIRTALELMRLRAGDVAFRRERQVIERQTEHLQRLVNDLLDVARITRGKLELNREPLELWSVISRALEMAGPLLEAKRHTLHVEVPRSGLRLLGDRHRLAQVFSNLLSNAARYTDAGGRITVSAERQGDSLQVRVRDNGRGIEPALLLRIFDLFVQGAGNAARQEGGLGIGLALVKNLVEMHGGDVQASSRGPGHGSEFVVRLALLDASQQPVPIEEPPTLRRGGRRVRLLLVDDNREAAEALAEALTLLGHEVRAAFDPAAALREAQGFAPEVAICDLGLPVMDGYELGRRLQQLRPQTPLGLVALTGYGQEEDHVRSRAAGFHAHLVKPVELSTLIATLSHVLGGLPASSS